MSPRWILIFIVLTGSAPSAPAVRHEGAVQEHRQDDALEQLRRSTDPFIDLAQTASELWKHEELRPALKGLLTETSIRPDLFVAVGWPFAKANERDLVPLFLEAFCNGRFDASQKLNLRQYVLFVYHRPQSIFPALESFVTQTEDEARSKIAIGLYAQLLEAVRYNQVRPDDADRFDAIARLLLIWAQLPAARSQSLGPSLADALVELTGKAVRFETREEWSQWFDRYREVGAESRRLSVARILRDRLESSETERIRVQTRLRAVATRLIKRDRDAGEPPVDFLAESDATIRRQAFVAIEAMADGLAPEKRVLAVEELARMMGVEERSPDVVGALVQAAGALGRKALPETKQRLATLVFGREWPNDPALLGLQLHAVLDIGLIDLPGRLATIYATANTPDRRDDERWSQVRGDAVKLADMLPDGDEPDGVVFVLNALDDANPEIRGVAASVLGAMNRKVEGREPSVLLRLAQCARSEKVSVPRRRMLEALQTLARRESHLLTEAVLRECIGIFRELEDTDARRLVVQIIIDDVTAPGFPEELRPDALSIVDTALAGAPDNPLVGITVDLLTRGEGSPFAAEVLAAWLVQRREHSEATSKAVDSLAKLMAARPDDLWALARSLAKRDDPWFDEAVRLAEAGLQNVTLPGEERIRRDELVAWQLGSDDTENWRRATEYLDARLAAEPRAALFVQRADLGTRLGSAEADPNRRAVALGSAEADLQSALAAESVGLDEGQRPDVWRRLGRVRLLRGNWAGCRAAWQRVRTLAGDRPLDRFAEARAIVLDPAADGTEALALLEGFDPAVGQELGDKLVLVRAAARCRSLQSTQRQAAAEELDRLASGETELARWLRGRLERERTAVTLLASYVETADPAARDDLVRGLGDTPETASRLVAERFERVTGEEEGQGLLSLLTRLFPEDAAVRTWTWPRDANGQAGPTLAAEVRKWLATRPLAEKFVQAFLKGT